MPRRLTCKDALMSRAQDAQERPGQPRAARGCTGAALVGLDPDSNLLAMSGTHRELANNTIMQA